MNQSTQDISQHAPEKRLDFLIKEARSTGELWILTDEHGCVMLNTEDEDCVPVWPSENFAKTWATGEWEDCKPMAIALDVWFERWTPGLEDDDVMIAAFPNPEEEGLILFPDEFDKELRGK